MLPFPFVIFMFRNIGYILKKSLARLCRLNRRCGYGIHSPFAFGYITEVVYGKVDRATKRRLRQQGGDESEAVRLLLYRMERRSAASHLEKNEYRITDSQNLQGQRATARPYKMMGTDTGITMKPQHPARRNAPWREGKTSKREVGTRRGALFQEGEANCGVYYINKVNDVPMARAAFRHTADEATPEAVLLINGINANSKMRKLWREIVADPAAGVTIDLWEAGIVFFNKRITKQDYVIFF